LFLPTAADFLCNSILAAKRNRRSDSPEGYADDQAARDYQAFFAEWLPHPNPRLAGLNFECKEFQHTQSSYVDGPEWQALF
jgi:hypothetical protein